MGVYAQTCRAYFVAAEQVVETGAPTSIRKSILQSNADFASKKRKSVTISFPVRSPETTGTSWSTP